MSSDDRRSFESPRLDRIENKLDTLTDYIVNVGRIDERVSNLEQAHGVNCKRLATTEEAANKASLTISGFVKGFWLIVSALTLAFTAWLVKGM